MGGGAGTCCRTGRGVSKAGIREFGLIWETVVPLLDGRMTGLGWGITTSCFKEIMIIKL